MSVPSNVIPTTTLGKRCKFMRVERTDYVVGNLLPATRREAVHEQGLRARTAHQFCVHLKGAKGALASLRLAFLAHAGPYVSVDSVGAGHGLSGFMSDLNVTALTPGARRNPGVRFVTRGG